MVVDLLDYDVRFGQGFLFSAAAAGARRGAADRRGEKPQTAGEAASDLMAAGGIIG